MNFRNQNVRAKFNLMLYDATLKKMAGHTVQLRLTDFVSSPGAEILLREHVPANYSEFVEPNIFSILQDGAIQSAISPICVEDYSAFVDSPNPSVPTVFSDGSDGDAVINIDTHLIKDTSYRNLTVNKGCKLYLDNWRLFVSGTIFLYGRIGNDGNDGRGNAGGFSVPDGFYASHGAGANGGAGGGPAQNGGGGGGGALIQNGVGLASFSGWDGGSGGQRDGASGAIGSGGSAGGGGSFVRHPNAGAFRSMDAGYYGQIFDANSVRQFKIHGNPGGGGGGGGGAIGAGGGNPGNGGNGGGCGSNGGIVFIMCRRLVGGGSITANGGNAGEPQDGAAAQTRYGGGGGGGGWGGMSGGGAIYLCTMDSTQFAGTITANAGIIKPIADPTAYYQIGIGGGKPGISAADAGDPGSDALGISFSINQSRYPEPPETNPDGQYNYVVTSPHGIVRGYFIKPYTFHKIAPSIINEIEGNAGYVMKFHIDQ